MEDMLTLHKSRLVFARFSVNVAIGTSLPVSIVLSSKWGKKVQPIIYENVGIFYQKCSLFGYLFIDCNKNNKSVEKGMLAGEKEVVLFSLEHREEEVISLDKGK